MNDRISVAIDSVLMALDDLPSDLLSKCQSLIGRIRTNCRELRRAEQRREVFAYSNEQANAQRDRELFAHVSDDLKFPG
jgi:hypothetical protein